MGDLAGAESEAETEGRLRHGSSFGAAAAAYAEHRPGYAEAAVRWALEPVQTRHPLRVLDLGAGTGKLTATLVRLGADVIAVEPDPDMLAELRRELPSVRSLPGSAEALPLPGQRRTAASLLATIATHSHLLVMDEPDRAALLAQVGDFLRSQPETSAGEFVLPMATVVLRALRK